MTTETTTTEATTSTTDTSTEDTTASTETSTETTETKDDSVNLGLDDDDGEKADGEKAEDGEGDDGEKAETSEFHGAPGGGETYDFAAIEMPEGMELDEEAAAAIDPVLRELNLSQAGAAKLLGSYASDILPRISEQVLKGVEGQVTETRSSWEADARSLIAGKDAEGKEVEPLVSKTGDKLGFDGKTLKDVKSTAAKALDRFAPPEFRKLLDETGLGVNPAMIAFTYQVGKLIGEDTNFDTTTTESKPASREAKYYGR